MSKYTIEIRHLKNTNFPFDEYMKNYPIWDEDYRKVLNNKIIDHYYFREIGFETPDRFGIRLKTKLNEIMPFYNELYKSSILDFNPLYNINYIETNTGEKDTKTNILSNNTSSSENVSDNTSSSENVSDNTTDSELSGSTQSNSDSSTSHGKTRTETVGSDIGSGQVSQTYLNSGQYANNHMITENAPSTDSTNTDSNSENTQTNKISYTGTDTGKIENTSIDTGKTENTSDTDSTGTENSVFEKVIKGYSGQNPNQAIKEFRQNIVNIDMMIIDELNTLFFGLLN